MSTEESRNTDTKRDEDNGSKKLPSRIAGIPVSEMKEALMELRVSKGTKAWVNMDHRYFYKAMEKKFKLEDGKLKYADGLSILVDQVEDDYRKEKMIKKRKEQKELEKKKKKKRKRRKNSLLLRRMKKL
jgi:hypothetical protein